jgi:hypothetical protein
MRRPRGSKLSFRPWGRKTRNAPGPRPAIAWALGRLGDAALRECCSLSAVTL